MYYIHTYTICGCIYTYMNCSDPTATPLEWLFIRRNVPNVFFWSMHAMIYPDNMRWEGLGDMTPLAKPSDPILDAKLVNGMNGYIRILCVNFKSMHYIYMYMYVYIYMMIYACIYNMRIYIYNMCVYEYVYLYML